MSRNRQRSFKKQIKKEKQREKEIKNQNKKSMRFDNKKEPEKILVGVYGFLRKGMQNHEQLDEDSPVAVYETAPEFTLYDIEGFACLDGLIKLLTLSFPAHGITSFKISFSF